MATHSSVLAWRIPGTREPGGLPSMGSHRVGHNWSDLTAAVLLKCLVNKILTISKYLLQCKIRPVKASWSKKKFLKKIGICFAYFTTSSKIAFYYII